METHLSHFALVRIFSGQASQPEVNAAAAHLAGCLPCLHLADRVAAELRRAGWLAELPGARAGILDPGREAQLPSMQASLATDIGHSEQAEALLARATANYGKAGDWAALASAKIQEAGTLLAACRHEEAVARAEEALRELAPRDARLELLARNIITASLVFLGRPVAALKNYLATRPLFEQLGDQHTAGTSSEPLLGCEALPFRLDRIYQIPVEELPKSQE